MVVRVCSVKNLIKTGITFNRSGIVPYCRRDTEIDFFFMIDARYGQMTDAGGRVSYRETFVDAAIREASEETRDFFDFRTSRRDIVENGIAIFDDDRTIIIIMVEVSVSSPFDICQKYQSDFDIGLKRGDKHSRLENRCMIIIDIASLEELALVETEYNFCGIMSYDRSTIEMNKEMSDIVSRSYCGEINVYPTLYKPVKFLMKDGLKKVFSDIT